MSARENETKGIKLDVSEHVSSKGCRQTADTVGSNYTEAPQ